MKKCFSFIPSKRFCLLECVIFLNREGTYIDVIEYNTSFDRKKVMSVKLELQVFVEK